MKNKQIVLSKSFSMDAVDYANQGNSLIGIRGSGKTYGAGVVAEQLLDAGIPIIAFDPTGVWQNLRNGVDGHPGYPVVVAGGMFGDLPLTENNAIEIVDAALKAGVSLVIDLKGLSTSNKSSWMRIVSSCVEFLMANNDKYGLRHVFIEEAAEFVPQKPNPGGQLVYSRIESLARMGRNFGLGYTLINQRAEEIAKAIFEISEQVFVFRQAGKNSLKSIKDWLDYRGLKDQNISETLPSLDNGQCWIINERQEVKISIPKKKTFHPDPKASKTTLPAGTKTADRTKFIDTMKAAMEEKKEKPVAKSAKAPASIAHIPSPGQAEEIRALKNKNADQVKTIVEMQAYIRSIELKLEKIYILAGALKKVEEITGPSKSVISKAVLNIDQIRPVHKKSSAVPANGKLNKCPLTILKFLAQHADRSFSKAQVGIATCYSPGSGGFNNALSELNTLNLIIRDSGKMSIADIPNIEDWTGPIEHQDYSIHTFKDKLGKCEREIYEVLLDNTETAFTKEELGAQTPSNYSPTSGGFNNALSTLNTLELISRDRGMIRLNPELLEL